LSTEILISSDPWENRVAVIEDGTLAELYVEREEKVIGSIYKGKVQNVLPGMGAAFVDIGLGRNAFLYVDDINKQPLNIGDVEITHGHSGFTISEKVKKGDDVLVQIVKEPRGLKGARISTNISLPGRYLILMPTGKYSGVSRKIESADERNRLKAVMKRIRPEGMATVVRTAAAGVSEAELIADLGVLIRMWHGILETFKRAPSPSLLHKDMNLVYKAARDFVTPDVDRVLIDDDEEYRKVREFLQLLGPQYLDRVQHYNSGRNLFEDYRIDEEMQRLMKPKINLPSGGSIVIESTEALTVIDVNSGKFTGGKNLEDTILKTNVEAAGEIARQVRLRDIGGIIVVDFIDMASESSRNKVVKALEEGLRRDRTRATIQSFSNLGLLEFTRKRIGKDLSAQLRGSCPTCNGLGTVMSPQSVAIDTFRKIRAHRNGSRNGEPLLVYVAPNVAAQMEFWYEDECKELARAIETKILVRVDPMLHPEQSRIVRGSKAAADGVVRVGDEFEVELLPARLPNVTSAAAVINGRIAEIENAANNAGNLAKIRVIDVDEDADYVLGELVTAGAAAAKKKRRRRKGELSAAEETKALRELAEEAASQEQARPPIGITTVTEEEEAEDPTIAAEVKAENLPDAIVIGEPDTQEEGARRRRRRRRRGRGRGRHGFDAAAQVGIPAESAAAQVLEQEREEEIEPLRRPEQETGEAGGRRRRRRRRKRGRGGAAGEPMPGTTGDRIPETEPLTGSLPMRPSVPDRHVFRVGADGKAHPTGLTAPKEPSRALTLIRRVHPPAVEPPPPHLTIPEEKPQRAKPARRRRVAPAALGGELEAAEAMRALPSPAEPATPRKRTRARNVVESATAVEMVDAAAEPKPKRSRAKKAEVEPAAGATPAPPEPKTSAKKTSSRKKSAATKSTARKKKS
jgi:ribonuclease G